MGLAGECYGKSWDEIRMFLAMAYLFTRLHEYSISTRSPVVHSTVIRECRNVGVKGYIHITSSTIISR